MGGRKTLGPKKHTAKQIAREKAKELKRQEKNEQTFAKAVHSSKLGLLEADNKFIMDTLSENPKWIQPLAGLIRAGSLNGLLKDITLDMEVGPVGARWKGRCRKWSELPVDQMINMINATGVSMSEKARVDEDFVKKCFTTQFWVGEKTPLPQRSDIRLVATLEKIAKTRVTLLKVNFLSSLNASDALDPLNPEQIALWDITANTLICRAFATKQEDYLEQELLKLPAGRTWKLSDAHSPECEVYDSDDGPFRFSCLEFFKSETKLADHLDTGAKWELDGLIQDNVSEATDQTRATELTATSAQAADADEDEISGKAAEQMKRVKKC